MAKTAYISSTFKDLKEHREAVYKALRKLRYDVVCMEDYVATDERNVTKCCAHAAECDIYIGIFARRYGYVPKENNPVGRSITEMEFRSARSSPRTKVRTFLLEDDAPWPDAEPEDASSQQKLAALRAELSATSYGSFRASHDLVEQVLASVYTAEAQTRVEPGPEDVSGTGLIPLESSGLIWITSKIQEAIKKSGSVAALKLSLGSGSSWWSTRLYLVSALLDEYTAIPQIVFLGGDGVDFEHPYLGICSPSDVRRALASHFRDVDRAYRASVPEQVFDAASEVPVIVGAFGGKVGALAPGGEREVMRWVAPHVAQQWRGFNSDCIELANRKLDGSLLDDIVAKRTPYVALVRNGKFEALIDRAELATNLALRRH
jgi:hypothetical protein